MLAGSVPDEVWLACGLVGFGSSDSGVRPIRADLHDENVLAVGRSAGCGLGTLRIDTVLVYVCVRSTRVVARAAVALDRADSSCIDFIASTP